VSVDSLRADRVGWHDYKGETTPNLDVLATDEVVAFIVDDAVAEPTWIAEHVRVYGGCDAVAVAGPVLPVWLEGEPD